MILTLNGFEVRFKYDGTKLKPSNISTNEIINNVTDVASYFKFEKEFENYLDIFTREYTAQENVINAIVAFYPPVAETDHIINDAEDGMLVSTQGGVLLGKMSFQMLNDEFDVSGFSLVQDTDSPLTGIKINLNIIEAFENQSTFRFTDATASKDATLSNLVVSSGTVDQDNPENSTYKEYELNPTFNKDTMQYELELLEYVDSLNIVATTSDSNASMKIKVPKRDEDGNLVYEADGSTIIYEEKDIASGVGMDVVLNELGEQDTVITVVVLAEDGKTTESYEVVVKRPYGIIKGKSILADFDNEDVVNNILDIYGVQVNNKTDINIYKTGLVNWESITDIYGLEYDDPMTYEKLENIDKEATYESENDGNFTIYVIPGRYDIQVTRLAYLDYIYSGVVINAGDEIDMGELRMNAGDANRDGVISQEDINEIKKKMDSEIDSEDFSIACNPTQLGVVVAEDLGYAKLNQDTNLEITYFSE